MSAGRYGKLITTSIQVKTGTTKLLTIICSSTSGGTYVIYDSDQSSASDPAMTGTVTPAANSQILYKSLVLKKGLYIVCANTISLTVIYE